MGGSAPRSGVVSLIPPPSVGGGGISKKLCKPLSLDR